MILLFNRKLIIGAIYRIFHCQYGLDKLAIQKRKHYFVGVKNSTCVTVGVATSIFESDDALRGGQVGGGPTPTVVSAHIAVTYTTHFMFKLSEECKFPAKSYNPE